MAETKRKLRTAADVISRLKWDSDSFGDSQDDSVFFGYSDRIHGPSERRCLQDYVPASQGGDIPEHRINYFRIGNSVLWDRRSRLDKIFDNSGDGTAHVCSETLHDIQLVKATAARLTHDSKRKPELPAVQLSKKMCKVLRHKCVEMGLTVTPHGYIAVNDLLALDRFRDVSVEEICAVVANNDKQRFKLEQRHDDLYIRANQGHSIAGVDY
jgi:uncharacterized protein (UPF0248 family)